MIGQEDTLSHSSKSQLLKIKNKNTDLVETRVFMNLPDPNETVSDDLNRTFFSPFLWDGKRENKKNVDIPVIRSRRT